MVALHGCCSFKFFKVLIHTECKYKPPKQHRLHRKRDRKQRMKRREGGMWKTVVKYLWRGPSQPSCTKLGFVRRRDHPCLNMSARLAKLLRLVSEMLPRSCTALARHETTPPPHTPSPYPPHPSSSVPPTNTALAGSLLFYLLPPSGFIYIMLYSYPDVEYSPSLKKHWRKAGWRRGALERWGKDQGGGWGGTCNNKVWRLSGCSHDRYSKTKHKEGRQLLSPF